MDASEVIYLDNNATTRLCPEALAAMRPFLEQWYGNPSSVHRFGQRARAAIDQARGQVATLVGCRESDVVFTSGGTESINTAVRGMLVARAPRKRIVTSSVEHSATRELCADLARRGLAEVVEVPVDRLGRLDLEVLRQAVSDDVVLVTLLWANNETGVVFDIDAVMEICRSRRVPLHLDATQAVGKLDVAGWLSRTGGPEVMSFSAHKFHGPKGVGGLVMRRGVRLPALLVGGPQERGRRGGTENVPGIVGMGAAAEAALAALPDMHRIAALRDHLESQILATIPQTSVNGDPAGRLPNTTNISFHRLEAEAILLLLSERGVCASAGAACASGSLEPSHVLLAMGIERSVAHGAIRFSLSRYTTPHEIDATLTTVAGVIDRLHQVLPLAVARTQLGPTRESEDLKIVR